MLNREIFVTLINVRVLLGWWRLRYNWIRPYFSLGYRSQASEAILTEKLSLGVGH
ncbi:MAG: transposase [Acidobacteria bacterium]|nr:transposase [Acidobacteriota bacterium]